MSSEPQDRPVVSVVIGTAGHIDHGKSSLVERLTGQHPSRLKEEQERGMTIDIGYAELPVSDTVTAGIIDVPGHEKFIRNMVAGATGVDFVLLVVAADDGVMPQTREHLQIMRLLGITHGMTVITKLDAVDPDLLEIVREDISEYLFGTFLEKAPMVQVSNVTGEGIDDVRRELARALGETPPKEDAGVFRMPIQRSFSIQGHGTVVTGVPVSGRVAVGDELEILPRGHKVRARGIQVHHRKADHARIGHRTALNVTDVSYRDVQRGDVVASRGYFSSAMLLEARLEYLDHLDMPLRNDTAIRFHTGTADLGGRLILLDKKVALPGESVLVQIRLDEPVVVAAGDRYIARLASPSITLGGGVIVGETRWRFKRFREWLNDNIAQKEEHLADPLGYLEYLVRSQGKRSVPPDVLAKAMKCSEPELSDRLEPLLAARKVRRLAKVKRLIHEEMFKVATQDVGEALLALHDADRIQAGFYRSDLARETKLELDLVEAIVADMVERTKFEILDGNLVRHKKYTGGLSKEDMKLVTRIEELHRAELFGSPIFSEIVADLVRPKKKVKELMTWLIHMKRLVPLTPELALHREAAEEAERRLVARLEQGPMPSSEFKDIIGATRKYVIPILEYFDKKGITQRDGNERSLVPGWEQNAFETTLNAARDS